MSIRKPDMTPVKTNMPVLDVKNRISSFDEVALGYTPEQAISEAERCMNCPERYCSQHCPAHSYIPEFIAEIRNGDFEAAYQLIARTNSLMGISSRVCPYDRQCESHCTRAIKGQPVAIGWLERFVSGWHDKSFACETNPPIKLDLSVAIVGSGPAGLTCAMSLVRSGIQVTVFERTDRLGGVAAWGIPSFELPPHLLKACIDELKSLGISFQLNKELGKDFTLTQLRESFDAVFLASGACIPVELNIDGSNLSGIVQASYYLANPDSVRGNNVVILGGGNTAVNAARTAVRLGAATVKILYRRTRDQLPSGNDELDMALEEGVELIELISPVRFIGENGSVSALECDIMELAAPNYPGGRANVKPSGKRCRLDADLAILALGFRNEKVEGVELDDKNRIVINKNYSTGIKGVYAGGDAVSGPSTLMKASAAGKDAAANIFADLIDCTN